MKVLTWSEAVVVGILAVGFLLRWEGGLTWGLLLFQISIFLQTFVTLWLSGKLDRHPSIHGIDRPKKSTFLFLSFLFLLAAAPAYFDPLWKKMQDYIQLDSGVEIFLSHILPPVLSGVTGVWFGIGTLAILAGLRVFWTKVQGKKGMERIFSLLPFFAITGLFAAIWLKSLIHAIDWELNKLHLMPTMISLFILLSVGGGLLFFALFQRIATQGPQGYERSQIGVLALSVGALFLFPIMWLLTRKGTGRWSWRLLLFSSLSASLLLGYYVLYGNLFDPWFTAFSYLKGAILMVTALVAAGILVLFFEELFPSGVVSSPRAVIVGLLLLIIFFAGFIPFRIFERYPEIKVANLQLNELSMVDATFVRELANPLGLSRWVRLGQNPSTNRHPEPWPLPWTLKKTHPSLLPKGFNLIVIVVDALRGDAFRSAGYERNLTPFLDRWALEEAISFRRAYSQGGGSFAAFPFLVAGRSPFKLYGPTIFKENLYFKLAQAEGIKNMMVIKEFGPRAIFPPDYPVIELDRSKIRSDRRSVPADEVFQWARDAIDNLPKDERFLCFLQLMDVHNDLWKKEDGLNLGDSPRDLYDNNLSYVDRAVERFVLWLKERGIYDRTVILFTSDHGEQFWEHGASLHGHTLYEEEIRVPLILLAHGIRKRVEDVPALSSDMAPTLADLAGYSVNPPYSDSHMGISLVPLLRGDERSRYLKRDIVGRASFKRRYFLYRNWEWKLIYLAELDLLQLFNTTTDPMERINLLQEKKGLAAELERDLFRYLEKVERKTYRPLLTKSSAGN
jgi:arylsulfatase A-like enzyme